MAVTACGLRGWLGGFTLLLLLCHSVSYAGKGKMRAEAEEEEEETSIRLPTDLRPVHYVVRLHPLIHGNHTIIGRLEVELEVRKSTSRVVFHHVDIDVIEDSVRVSLMSKRRTLPVKRQRYDPEYQQYTVQLRRRLRQGNTYLLSMHFRSMLGNATKGFFVTTYKDREGNERKVAATQFWPADARRAFPCFDEPEMKATFDVYLARDVNMTAISNMPLVRSTPVHGWEGWVWDQFATSFNMSTYLVAFVISDYRHRVLDSGAKTRLEVYLKSLRLHFPLAWTRRDALDQTGLALKVANYSLHFFENYFNLSYPLRKMDLVALPETSFSAMENWGLITCRESLFLVDPANSSATQQRNLARLMSHEMAHQWFGNLVTPKWWTDLWLSEGFATYMANVAIDQLEPNWGLLDGFVVEQQQYIMHHDGLRSSHPVSDAIPSPAFIYDVFDEIPYNKGASIIRMMQHFLTEETFKRGLTSYLYTLKYANANQDDLWHFMTEAYLEDSSLPSDVTVKTIMDTWTLQEGYPVVTVTIDHNGNAKLTQKRFLTLGDEKEEDLSYKWWVPVTFTSQKRPLFRHTRAQTWLSSHADHVTVTGLPPPQFWHIFNLQMTGYYRVNYHEYNWNLLALQLQEDHEVIHVTNRAQIIDDALALARAGLLSYKTALNTTMYLQGEESHVAWKAAFRNMQFLCDMFRYTASYGALKEYFLSLLKPLYDTLGFKNDPEADLQTQLLRQEVVAWACLLQDNHCVNTSALLFRRWMEGREGLRRGVNSDIAMTVYCTALSRGNEREWEFAWRRFRNAKSRLQREALGSALGCTSRGWILAMYLEEALGGGSGLRQQDVSLAFKAVARSEVGTFVAWHFLRENWRELSQLDIVDISTLSEMVMSAVKYFNTDQQLEQVKQLLEDAADDHDPLKKVLHQALETVERNVMWRRKYFDVVNEWLDERGFSYAFSEF
ncbi:aminopeptidase N-like [Penaeus japonicus]|uniref:aminopeptidase N-like n=1 Tax=Penaeus japonicus TaxID=27405 RepID=UPI001C70E650|nr:aminopeptidase N-like [Penaeus japonicus]